MRMLLASVTLLAVLGLIAPSPAIAKGGKVCVTKSMDGRNTGRGRTCGYELFVYDQGETTVGPYCH